MKRVVSLLLLAVSASVAFAEAEPTLPMVSAFQKNRPTVQPKPKLYPTRTIAQLTNYTAAEPQLDKYGGLLNTSEKATGFFHTLQKDGRWWLVDPDGHLFIATGIVGVGIQHGPTFKENFDKKFGNDNGYREATLKSLADLGFHATGAWSDDQFLQSAPPAERIPYLPLVSFMAGYGKQRGGTYQQPGHTGYPGDCIFVFDEGFEKYADQLGQKLAANKDDPWLIGYQSDNEMPYPADLLKKYLTLPKDDPGRIAAEKWLAEKNRKAADITADDMEEFRGFVADRYYGIVEKAIHKYDPNHLYVGSRCNSKERYSEPFMKAQGKHVDIVTVNVYGLWSPKTDIEKFAETAGKPIMVTEFYAKGEDSGMLNDSGAGWTVATQKDRGAFYQNFTLDLLESKTSVGWTWFKYADNDPRDMSTDPSNRTSNKGILNDKYDLYVPLTDAMSQLNHQAYTLVQYFDSRK